ncbi:hypothetical protein [Metabacillus sp. 84]|uniref:hypothetical protein n=1 Tax=unclassified Metabacillus TaxID=2675274 RepID=UPI003CEDD96A
MVNISEAKKLSYKEYNELQNGQVNHAPADSPCGAINLIAADCCRKQIPEGFAVIGPERLAYNLNQLRVLNETCVRNVFVEGCGNVEVEFNQLRVVGCIPYVISTVIQGDCGGEVDSSSLNQCEPFYTNQDNRSHMCCEGKICVDNVLLCSADEIGDYEINCENVQLTGFNRFITSVFGGCDVLQQCFTNNYFVEFTFVNLPEAGTSVKQEKTSLLIDLLTAIKEKN